MDEPKVNFESCHSKGPSGMEVEDDPRIHIQSSIYQRKNGGHPPFYLALHINNLLLHNIMLDSRASMNIIPLKIMKEMGLEITRHYRNVCAIFSKSV